MTDRTASSKILLAVCKDGRWDCDKRGTDREGLAARLDCDAPEFFRVSLSGFEQLVERHGLGPELGLAVLDLKARTRAVTLH